MPFFTLATDNVIILGGTQILLRRLAINFYKNLELAQFPVPCNREGVLGGPRTRVLLTFSCYFRGW